MNVGRKECERCEIGSRRDRGKGPNPYDPVLVESNAGQWRERDLSALFPGLKREWVDELASELNLNRLTGKLLGYRAGPSA
jgi:hypothetical protein